MRIALVLISATLFLVACSGGGSTEPPTLQASFGTSNSGTGATQTAVVLLLRTPGSTAPVTVTVTGPTGWNAGQPVSLSAAPGAVGEFTISAAPISGSYEAKMTIDGTDYRA